MKNVYVAGLLMGFVFVLGIIATMVVMSSNKGRTMVTVSPSPQNQTETSVAPSEATTVSPSKTSPSPTADAKHSGEGEVSYVGTPQGSKVQQMMVEGVGYFTIFDDTKIFDAQGTPTTISAIKKGSRVYVSGTPGEGAIRALSITIKQ